MRRSRLKILPSRCVATLGFILLLLACPTIAEEIVRPPDLNEPSASHMHARIKNGPPDEFKSCQVGDQTPDSMTSLDTLIRTLPSHEIAKSWRVREARPTPLEKSSSRRNTSVLDRIQKSTEIKGDRKPMRFETNRRKIDTRRLSTIRSIQSSEMMRAPADLSHERRQNELTEKFRQIAIDTRTRRTEEDARRGQRRLTRSTGTKAPELSERTEKEKVFQRVSRFLADRRSPEFRDLSRQSQRAAPERNIMINRFIQGENTDQKREVRSREGERRDTRRAAVVARGRVSFTRRDQQRERQNDALIRDGRAREVRSASERKSIKLRPISEDIRDSRVGLGDFRGRKTISEMRSENYFGTTERAATDSRRISNDARRDQRRLKDSRGRETRNRQPEILDSSRRVKRKMDDLVKNTELSAHDDRRVRLSNEQKANVRDISPSTEREIARQDRTMHNTFIAREATINRRSSVLNRSERTPLSSRKTHLEQSIERRNRHVSRVSRQNIDELQIQESRNLMDRRNARRDSLERLDRVECSARRVDSASRRYRSKDRLINGMNRNSKAMEIRSIPQRSSQAHDTFQRSERTPVDSKRAVRSFPRGETLQRRIRDVSRDSTEIPTKFQTIRTRSLSERRSLARDTVERMERLFDSARITAAFNRNMRMMETRSFARSDRAIFDSWKLSSASRDIGRENANLNREKGSLAMLSESSLARTAAVARRMASSIRRYTSLERRFNDHSREGKTTEIRSLSERLLPNLLDSSEGLTADARKLTSASRRNQSNGRRITTFNREGSVGKTVPIPSIQYDIRFLGTRRSEVVPMEARRMARTLRRDQLVERQNIRQKRTIKETKSLPGLLDDSDTFRQIDRSSVRQISPFSRGAQLLERRITGLHRESRTRDSLSISERRSESLERSALPSLNYRRNVVERIAHHNEIQGRRERKNHLSSQINQMRTAYERRTEMEVYRGSAWTSRYLMRSLPISRQKLPIARSIEKNIQISRDNSFDRQTIGKMSDTGSHLCYKSQCFERASTCTCRMSENDILNSRRDKYFERRLKDTSRERMLITHNRREKDSVFVSNRRTRIHELSLRRESANGRNERITSRRQTTLRCSSCEYSESMTDRRSKPISSFRRYTNLQFSRQRDAIPKGLRTLSFVDKFTFEMRNDGLTVRTPDYDERSTAIKSDAGPKVRRSLPDRQSAFRRNTRNFDLKRVDASERRSTLHGHSVMAPNYLFQSKSNAIKVPEETAVPIKEHSAMSSYHLVTESSFKIFTEFLPALLLDLNTHGFKLLESIFNAKLNIFSKTGGHLHPIETPNKFNEWEDRSFLLGDNEEPRQHLKMTAKEKIFSAAIGGCIAALSISTSTK